MKKIISLFGLIALFLISFPILSQTRLGLQFTQEELNIWRERAIKGPYLADGDVAPNTPGDWKRIVAKKNVFLTNPSAARWIGPTYSGCVLVTNGMTQVEGVDVPHKINTGNMQDAAFYALITNDNNIKNLVKKELLWQASQPLLDFTNTSKWCRGKLGDGNPIFDIAVWGVMLIYTYEFVEDVFTTSEKQIFQNWIQGLAGFMQYEVDTSLNKLWKNRQVEKVEDYVYNYSTKALDYTHINGYRNTTLQLHYNNRKAHMMQLVGLVGIKYNKPTMITTSKKFIMETIAFACYPDGIFAELHRGTIAYPSRGLSYLTNTFGAMIMVADALARTGDFSMYDFKTTHGLGYTKGQTVKSLEWIITEHGKYLDGHKNIYRAGGVLGNVADKIDGYFSNRRTVMMNDVTNFAIANIYYNNPYNKSIYLRTAPGIYPYPPKANLSTNGVMSAWKGLVGHTAGLFMYGQMEGKVWPYPSKSAPVANKVPVVSAGNDITVTLASANLTITGSASDPDGSIASYKWARITGPTVEMSNTSEPTVSMNVTAAGTYVFRLSVSDDKGATAYDEVTVTVTNTPTPPLILSLTTKDVSCHGGSDGFISVSATGGDENYSYIWSNSANTSKIENLSPGEYTVKVFDTNGDTATASAKIFENTLITIFAIFQDETSNGADGAIDLSVSGGIKPYVFKWSNGATSDDIAGLKEGEYTVSVTDSLGCSATNTIVIGKASVNVEEPEQEPLPQDSVITEEPEEDPVVIENPKEDPILVEGPEEQEETQEPNKPETVTESEVQPVAFNVRKVFSPNGDGLGDETWTIENVEEVKGCTVTVFTNSGRKVFETQTYNNDWDGRINGKEVSEGAYFYVIHCPESNTVQKGAIRLIR